MDVLINSQVQSPLVRVLQTVPAQADSFTHHIPDNVPPLDKEKVVLNPFNSPSRVFGSTFKFRIPEYGYLRRCYLRVTTSATFPVANEEDGNSAMFLFKLIKSATMETHNKTIQTLYGDEMGARMHLLPLNKRVNAELMADGYSTTDYVTPVDYAASGIETIRWMALPFASTAEPHLNFNTKFVEDLEVHVKTALPSELYVVNGPSVTVLNVELVCLFHHFHDSTEQAIRNENYQQSVPASLLLYDTYQERPHVITAGQTTANIELKSNNLAYAMTILLMRSATDFFWTAGSKGFSSVELWLGNQRYTFGPSLEQSVLDRSDYNLAVRTSKQIGYGPTDPERNIVTYLNFGLHAEELFNSGCVGLQSVNKPELRLTLSGLEAFDMTVYVFVHYHAMLRIDSGSGVITRTIDQ